MSAILSPDIAILTHDELRQRERSAFQRGFARGASGVDAKLDARLPVTEPAGEEVPETILKAVERVLDEHSAWIARPNRDVAKAVAVAAGTAWSLHTDAP